MKLSPRDQVIVAAVLIVVIAGGFFVLAILPQFGAVADLDLQIVDVSVMYTWVLWADLLVVPDDHELPCEVRKK